MPSISTRNWAFSLLLIFLLSAASNGVESDSSPSWTDLIQPATALLLPPPALSGTRTHMREATSVIGKLTAAAIQSPENQSQILVWNQEETDRCFKKTSKQILLEQRMLIAQTKSSQAQLEASRTSLEDRLELIGRQCQYMTVLWDGDEEGTERELRRTALQMAAQADELRNESENACNQVNQTLESLYSRVARVDDNVAELREEYEELVRRLKMGIAENIELLINRISELNEDIELDSEESAQFTIEDVNLVSDKLNQMKMSIDGQFSAIDKSIVTSEQIVVNRLQEMYTQWTAQFKAINTSQDVIVQLTDFHQSLLDRTNDLQAAMTQVQSAEQDLTNQIYYLKRLVSSWTNIMENTIRVRPFTKHRRVKIFKRLCQRHDPLSVVAWIQQNITETIKSPGSPVPEQSYQTWRHRLLWLRNDAFLMHAACLSSTQGIYGWQLWRAMQQSYWELFRNNYLQDATSMNRLHYARWWNQNINKSGLVSQFETETQSQLESTFATTLTGSSLQ